MEDIIKLKLDQFFKSFPSNTFEKGKTLIEPNEAPSKIYYLVEGCVREFALTTEGKELGVYLFKPPAFFPAAAAVGAYTPRYFFETQVKSKVYYAPKEQVKQFLDDEPLVVMDLFKRVYRGLDFMSNQYLLAVSQTSHNRLLNFLLVLTERFDDKKQVIPLKLTHDALANLTGLTRETVTRMMNNWRNFGFIGYEKGIITIINRTGLEKSLE